jgi:hypothetical protein
MLGLERLHYFNGQRLVAKDFELEQRYFIRVRRMLNRGLYSAGVVSGLEVSKVDGRHVRVSGGVALDPGGREVILLADTTLIVPNRLPTSTLSGFFLTIQYGEDVEPGVMADCRMGNGTTPPSRIREAPVLAFTETWPDHSRCGQKGHASDCAVVLGLVVLDASCQISGIESGVRQWAHSQLPRQANTFALEGEKDIDTDNPKRLHFQIRGGFPSAVLLYLWGDAFSSLYYTELGSHDHGLSKVTTSTAKLPDHKHDLSGVGVGQAKPQTHHHQVSVLFQQLDDNNLPNQITNGPLSAVANATYRTGIPQFLTEDGAHTHDLTSKATGSPLAGAPGITQTLIGKTDAAGNTAPPASTPYQARGGPAYDYLDDLRIKFDGTDITGLVTAKLGWSKIGDGTNTHALVLNGTGGIDLLQLGLSIGPGAHELDLRVPSGGGKVLYNLYVE